ncbi:hypothetical protein QYE76_019880 [Lolium multiflorum]|uniref:Transposase n=1 Tax=Lolium multiflorum TaxID=4521 RepID=A0AAD8R3T7_LOLMU|nr:hypothetical protein QYE76_019880 [Lolium multiflorum]
MSDDGAEVNGATAAGGNNGRQEGGHHDIDDDEELVAQDDNLDDDNNLDDDEEVPLASVVRDPHLQDLLLEKTKGAKQKSKLEQLEIDSNTRYPRNIRLGASTDGFNPFGNQSSTHSTWPVFVWIYNLPPWLCMKRKYIQMRVRVPFGYSGLISRYMDPKKRNFSGMKSHDCHVMMTQILPVAIRGIMDDHVRATLTGLCNFFDVITRKSISVKKLARLQEEIVVILCEMEMYFPPAFFDVMVHLLIHIMDDIVSLGPAFLHNMMPFERMNGVIKGYVRNRSHPDGSIVQGWLTEECISFCTNYLDIEDPVGLPQNKHVRRFEGVGHKNGRKELHVHMSGRTSDFDRANLVALQHIDLIDPWLKEHKTMIENSGKPMMTEAEIYREHNSSFARWFKDHIDTNPPPMDSDKDKLALALSHGPAPNIMTYQAYDINGYTFYTEEKDKNSVYQNSGVTMDSWTGDVKTRYYGRIEEIWELNYAGEKVPMFRIRWAKSVKRRPDVAKGYGNQLSCILREVVNLNETDLRAESKAPLRAQLIARLHARYKFLGDYASSHQTNNIVNSQALLKFTKHLSSYKYMVRKLIAEGKGFEEVHSAFPHVTQADFDAFVANEELQATKNRKLWGKEMRELNIGNHNLGSRGYEGKEPYWAKEDEAYVNAGIENPWLKYKDPLERRFIRSRYHKKKLTGELVTDPKVVTDIIWFTNDKKVLALEKKLALSTPCTFLMRVNDELKDVARGSILRPLDKKWHTRDMADDVYRVEVDRALPGYEDLFPPNQPHGADDDSPLNLASLKGWVLLWPKTLIRINTYSGSTASKDKHLAAPHVSVPPRQPAAPWSSPTRRPAPRSAPTTTATAPEAEEYERDNFQWDIPTSSQVVHEDAPA